MSGILNLSKLPVNSIVNGFKKIDFIKVPEFRMEVSQFIHERTNAKHFHISRDDKNKAFGVLFRTPPPNSSGVPHILEHTVLCGSKKFPVRDPFFKMLTRSQATFMNAMTASDWTLYPFSTMNDKDFINLLHIYCDAVFNPRLDELNFLQEGWRLEPSETNNDRFDIKGVVYNEMKGVFSNSMSEFAHKCENSLLPNTYPYNSGGDPMAIPDLTYNQLKDFHAKLYHPTNSRFYTYGNVNLEQIMDIIDTEYLSKFDKSTLDTSIQLEPFWKEPKSIKIHCEPDPLAADASRGSSISINYASNDSTNTYDNFCMDLVSSLLISGDNAPLYQALIESGIGQGWADHLCGYDSSHRTSTFHIGIQGVADNQLEQVEQVTEETLRNVVQNGFPKERIESLLHQIEMGLRHEGANFGLHLILSMSYPTNHDVPLENTCVYLENVNRIKKDLEKDPKFLEKIVEHKLLNNSHKLTITMTPKSGYNNEKVEEENKLIDRLNSNLTDKKKKVIIEKAEKLAEIQKKTENLDCLPCLQLEDIPTKSEDYPYELVHDGNIQLNKYNTNGLLYFKVLFDLKGVDSELIPYIPLFCGVVTELSTDKMTYREIDQEAESCCSGMSLSTEASGGLYSLDCADDRYGVLLSSHCLYRNTDRMMNLWDHILHNVQFDSDLDRLYTLIQMATSMSWSANEMVGSAHMFAMKRAGAAISTLNQIEEIWNGIEQAKLMKELATYSKDQLLNEVVPKLKQIKSFLFNKNRMKIAVNLESEEVSNTLPILERFMNNFPSSDYKAEQLRPNLLFPSKSHVVLPYTVNYTATAIESACFIHPDYAKSRILSRLLSSKYLLREVREIGGAYGVGATAHPGYFSFFTYRDPQSIKSLQKFQDSLKWSIDQKLDEQLLTESKLAIFQQIDKPLSASSKGVSYFRTGVTTELRQKQRDELFNVTIEDMKEVAQKLLNCPKQSHVVIGPDSQDLTTPENKQSSWERFQFNQ